MRQGGVRDYRARVHGKRGEHLGSIVEGDVWPRLRKVNEPQPVLHVDEDIGGVQIPVTGRGVRG